MPVAPLHLSPGVDPAVGFDAIRSELGLPPGFSAEVTAEAEAAATAADRAQRVDMTDVELVTIDPPGARDLDQALHIERAGEGWTVRYAIADLSGFVAPGGAIDEEARRRVATVYLPDGRVPLHPEALSEGAASLLPGRDRPAVVWTIRLDAAGETVDFELRRALVRSRAQLTYAQVQAELDAGSDGPAALLEAVGRARQAREADRGGVSLPIPDQEVVFEEGRYRLEYRSPLPVEGWNAQISLLAGMCAGYTMLEGRIGVLRTLPQPSEESLSELRRHAGALGVDWPAGATYGEVIRGLDLTRSTHAAFAAQTPRLFRGAGYAAFDGSPDAPVPVGAEAEHGAVAAPYAHVTAPLRRLVDRFGIETTLALHEGREVPRWVAEALPTLPALMAEGGRRDSGADAMARDLVEAVILADRIGDELPTVVVGVNASSIRVQVPDPAVLATVPLPGGSDDGMLGREVVLRVAAVDVARRKVDLEVVASPS